MYYVYSLKLKNGFYVGCTNDLKDRIKRHKAKQVDATKDKLPLELEFYIAFKNQYLAFNFEKYLKTGSGRAFIQKHFF